MFTKWAAKATQKHEHRANNKAVTTEAFDILDDTGGTVTKLMQQVVIVFKLMRKQALLRQAQESVNGQEESNVSIFTVHSPV